MVENDQVRIAVRIRLLKSFGGCLLVNALHEFVVPQTILAWRRVMFAKERQVRDRDLSEIESGALQTNTGGQTILCFKQATNGLSSLT